MRFWHSPGLRALPLLVDERWRGTETRLQWVVMCNRVRTPLQQCLAVFSIKLMQGV